MKENDTLIRFIFENTPIRGELIRLERSYQEIIEQHPYPEPMRRLIGETLCVAGLLSAIIKFDGRLTVQFRGTGKLKFLLAQCDNAFNLRALAKWDGDLSYEELMESFSQGVLVIMLDSGINKAHQYQGIVAWRGNSLVESIEGYFKDSEQLATKIWLAVDEHHAAGYLLQVVPPTESEAIAISHEVTLPRFDKIIYHTSLVTNDELLQADHEVLLRSLYPAEEIRVFPPDSVAFKCTCTRKRGQDAILILGREEAEDELKDKNSIVVTCDFCNKEYVFDKIEVAKIFEDHRPPTDTHLH
jgi:molecular chaperone Hsp33